MHDTLTQMCCESRRDKKLKTSNKENGDKNKRQRIDTSGSSIIVQSQSCYTQQSNQVSRPTHFSSIDYLVESTNDCITSYESSGVVLSTNVGNALNIANDLIDEDTHFMQ